MIGIYKITNPIGEVYIGKSKNIYQRFLSHKNKSGYAQLKLKKSYQIHGFDNHSFKVIFECNENDLNIFEAFFIDRYNSVNDGLNGQNPNVDISNVDKCIIELNTYPIKEIDTEIKAKQIHLDEKVIKALTFLAVKDNTTFKELAQKILELAAIESGYYEQSNSN